MAVIKSFRSGKTLSNEEAKHDQQFFDRFIFIIGLLMGVAVFLFVIARWIGVAEQTANMQNDPAYQQAVGERIEPVARIAVAGEDFVDEAAAVVEVETVKTVMTGPQVYNAVCSACHGAGIAGAPKTGDAGAWTTRVAAGRDSVNGNAINGFQGAAGFMPPKGGRTDLSDGEIIDAVQYMLDQL